MATIIQTLKISNLQRKKIHNPNEYRRDRLLNIIAEQITGAQATANGEHFMPKVSRLVVNKFTGEKVHKECPKRFRPCWWVHEDGKTYMELRYGARALEISKGKTTIEVGEMSKLLPTLELLRDAVLLGEFDDLLSSASSRLAAQLRAKRTTPKS
jgi:hypothetical protein